MPFAILADFLVFFMIDDDCDDDQRHCTSSIQSLIFVTFVLFVTSFHSQLLIHNDFQNKNNHSIPASVESKRTSHENVAIKSWSGH